MTQTWSSDARSTVVEHLERLLCNPTARANYISKLKKCTNVSIDDWELDLLQQLMDDPQRLEVLDDNELQKLLSDPVGLNVLGEEITRDWWPAWAEPLAVVGREWREQASDKPPTWDDIVTEPTECNPTEVVETEALAGHLGEVLNKVHESKGRALLFEWAWTRTRKQLGLTCKSAKEARLLTEFRLRAYGKRQGTLGEWVLSIAGEPPKSHAAVTLRLTGWGHKTVDITNALSVQPGVTEIRLNSLPEPSPIFADWPSGAAEVSVACVGIPFSWQTTEMVPAPRLDRSFYELWVDPGRTDGMDNCLARLVAILGGQRKIKDDHKVFEAMEEASREVYRRRYAGYRDITSTGEFTRLVVKAAKRHYLKTVKKKGRVFPLLDYDKDMAAPPEADIPEDNPKLKECVRFLSVDFQTVLRLRYEDDLSFAEIGQQLKISEGNARQKNLRARKMLDECLERYA